MQKLFNPALATLFMTGTVRSQILFAALVLLHTAAAHAQSNVVINCTDPKDSPGRPPETFQISGESLFWYDLNARRFEPICRMWNIEKPITTSSEPAKCTVRVTAQKYHVHWHHRYRFSSGGDHTQDTSLLIDRFTLQGQMNDTNGFSARWSCMIGDVPKLIPKI